MAGNSSGLIRIGNAGGQLLLRVNPSSTALANPLQAYGNAGNDSGLVLVEGIGFGKLGLQGISSPGQSAVPGGYTFTAYYTHDPRAYAQWEASFNPNKYLLTPGGAPQVPASSWIQIPIPSDQSGGGVETNPFGVGQGMHASLGIVAVRVVLTAIATPTGSADAIGFLTP